jgi:23S rRNA (uracil1939-C5)-methyltransferase
VVKRGDAWSGTAEILEPSPARVEPACPHFGACGGCTLQHWRDADYIAWKSHLLTDALRRAGFPDALITIARTPPGARRRMDLAIKREAGIILGLHRARGAEVLDLTVCPVLDARLVALFAPLRTLLAGLDCLKRTGRLVANLLDTGPDILLRTDADLKAADRSLLAAFARTHAIPRISWSRSQGAPETAVLLRPAVISLSGVPVTPPPGAFLQASREGESAIVSAVLAGLPEKLPARARIAELYAGSGTLTFALATRARVLAWEGDAEALAALRKAASSAGLTGRIIAERRDLTHAPIRATEIKDVAAIVLDPPHAGAPAQLPEIVRAKPPVVIYVSCNPATLSRDLKPLAESGYHLKSATAIDQFLWSARLESVTVLTRPS